MDAKSISLLSLFYPEGWDFSYTAVVDHLVTIFSSFLGLKQSDV